MNIVKFLRETDLFYGLREDHLQALARICREVKFKNGEEIVKENSPSDELFIIVEGQADIIIDPHMVESGKTRSSAPTAIVRMGQGQTFGEIGLVDRGLRSASVRAAAKDTQLISISREDLLNLCERNFELGYYVMRNIATEMAFKIRNTDLMLRAQIVWQPEKQS